MFNKKRLKVSLVKNSTMKMVHDDDLESLLKSLGVYNEVLDEKFKCLFCGNTITMENIETIIPYEGSIQFTCDSEQCHKNTIGIGDGYEF